MKNYLFYLLIITMAIANPITSIAGEADNSEETAKKPDADEEDPLSGAEITIRKVNGRTLEEYRINGRLIQVKVTPKYGYPYYIIDADGDSIFDVRSNEEWKNTTINTWKIFQW